MQGYKLKLQKLKNIVNKFATTLLLMTAVITAPVVFGDGDIATNKTIIDSFKKDLQKEDGLSPEERQRYNLLYTEFVNDLSSSIDRAEKNGESEKRIKRHKKILSKRIKILDELPTGRKISLLKMYENGLKQVNFNQDETKDRLCGELVVLQRIINNYNNYLNGGKLNTSYIDLKQSALAINERFKTEVITEQQIENMGELDDFVSVQQKAELAKNEAELAEMKKETAEIDKNIANLDKNIAEVRKLKKMLESL